MSDAADLSRPDPLIEEDVHLLQSRAVLRCGTEWIGSLQSSFTSSLDRLDQRCVFALNLDERMDVVADVFLVRFENDVLIDCDGEDLAALTHQLTSAGIGVQDVSNDWRVLAELPNQRFFEAGAPFVRVSDPRCRELGARIYRGASSRESTAWRHEGLYRAHTYKLGIPPRVTLLQQLGVGLFEAHLHALGALDAEHVPAKLADELRAASHPQRRVLPFRVEPTGHHLPDMDAAPLLADGSSVGIALVRQGLWGLGLVDLAPWREALAGRISVVCEGEPVLITWPTWIARESEGRASPVARKDREPTP
ncbi:MAG: hypothetical protein GY939_10370 [Actinomycetia bacterium]|nr:hypothetical protein [Actinomycetes bacterium]